MDEKQSKQSQELEVSVVLPTYEEKDNIVHLIDSIYEHVKSIHEVIVVDDDSPDGTSEAVRDLQATHPTLRLIHRKNERGLTTAIRDGVRASSGNVIVWMDCDLSMRPEVIPSLIEKIKDGNDVAVGSRYVSGGRDDRDVHFHKLLSFIICHFASTVLNTPVGDLTSGFIAIKPKVLEGFDWRDDYGEYFISLIDHANQRGFKMVEVPYVLKPRATGASKTATNILGFAVRGRKYISTIIKLRLARRNSTVS